MDETLITPFIASVQAVFSTAMQLPVVVDSPHDAGSGRSREGVRAVVRMSGQVEGLVVLWMPARTAQAIASVFVGARLEVDDPDFADAVGELVNMICGNAKSLFHGKPRVTMSCPSVVIGPAASATPGAGEPGVVIPCSTDCGELAIELYLRESSGRPERAMEAAAARR